MVGAGQTVGFGTSEKLGKSAPFVSVPELLIVPMVHVPPVLTELARASFDVVVPVRLQVAVLVNVKAGLVAPNGLSRQVVLAGPVAESHSDAVVSV